MKALKLSKLLLVVFVASSFFACSSSKKVNNNFYQVYSSKLGVQLEGKENKKLIKSMSEWKGTPYKYASASKRGTDCSGFVSQLYSEVYGKKLHRSSRDMVKDVRYISKGKLQAGDLIFFKIKSRKVSHVAVYVANNKFIHATTRNGVRVDDMNNKYYKKYYYKSGRVRM